LQLPASPNDQENTWPSWHQAPEKPCSCLPESPSYPEIHAFSVDGKCFELGAVLNCQSIAARSGNNLIREMCLCVRRHHSRTVDQTSVADKARRDIFDRALVRDVKSDWSAQAARVHRSAVLRDGADDLSSQDSDSAFCNENVNSLWACWSMMGKDIAVA